MKPSADKIEEASVVAMRLLKELKSVDWYAAHRLWSELGDIGNIADATIDSFKEVLW